MGTNPKAGQTGNRMARRAPGRAGSRQLGERAQRACVTLRLGRSEAVAASDKVVGVSVVERLVGDVRVHVYVGCLLRLHVLALVRRVRRRRQQAKPRAGHVRTQRRETRSHYVKAQRELATVEQQRALHVALHDAIRGARERPRERREIARREAAEISGSERTIWLTSTSTSVSGVSLTPVHAAPGIDSA